MLVKQKKLWLLLPVFLAFTSIVSLGFSPSAYADYTVPAGQNCNDGSLPQGLNRNCTDGDTANGTGGQPETGTPVGEANNTSDDSITCAIEKVGWILCPVIETAGRVGDQAFQFLAKNFLETEPELVAANSGTYQAWELGRNIANILFIIAFLVIIYSQVTGTGINNYGIKRMFPRLILAALAVNVSYFICQGMVDLTNIIGYEVQNFMVDTAQQVTKSVVMPPQRGMDIETGNGVLGSIAIGALGLGAAVWFLLPVLFLGISVVVVTCLVIIVLLLLRKAFIVLLVVIAPIAFVAYLLPNTEKLFSKWLNMFWQLLLVFPIIGLLFGAGQLASAIVLVAGTNGSSTFYKDEGGKCISLPKAGQADSQARVVSCSTLKEVSDGNGDPAIQASESTPFMLGLTAAMIAVAPLIAVWAVLKGALSAAGAIGGKIAGAIQTYGNRGGDRAKKAEDSMRKAAGQGIAANALNGGFGRRTAGFVRRRQLGKERRESALEAAKAGYDAGDPGASAMSKEILASKMASSAAKGAAQSEFMKDLARDRADVSDALGVYGRKDADGNYINPEIGSALAAQQTKAVADAIKEVQLSSDFKPGDLGAVGEALAKAVEQGDTIRARAFQSMLLTSGNAGLKQFHTTMGSVQQSASYTPGMDQSLRQNIFSNHGSIKDADASIGEWAAKGGSLSDVASSASTWNGITAAKFAGMSAQAQAQGAQLLSQQAINDLHANAQYLGQVAGDARVVVDSRKTP